MGNLYISITLSDITIEEAKERLADIKLATERAKKKTIKSTFGEVF